MKEDVPMPFANALGSKGTLANLEWNNVLPFFLKAAEFNFRTL